MDKADLSATVDACRSLIRDRFHDDDHHGAAAMLLDDGTILTGTSPKAINPSVEVLRQVRVAPAGVSLRQPPCLLADVS